MKNSSSKPDPWKPCEPGIIETAKLSAPVAIAGRREFIKTVGGGSAVLALTTFAGWSLFGQDKPQPNQPSAGNGEMISCSKVLVNLQGYVGGKIVDQSLNCQIHSHLQICQSCHKVMQQIKGV